MRADSGFFAQELLGFLEEKALPYLVVAKLTQTIKRRAAGIGNWTEVDADYAVGEFFGKLQGWDKERRFVVVRERVREAKEAVGRKLIDGIHVSDLCHQPDGRSLGALAGLQQTGRD